MPEHAQEKPWLAQDEWAAGRIRSSASSSSGRVFALIFAFFLLAIAAPAVRHIPEQLRAGNHLILITLLFPLTAFCCIGWAFLSWRQHRRFGDCFFQMTTVPGALGGTLTGQIQTSARLRLEHGLRLKLSCIRRIFSRAAGQSSPTDSILWQDEKVLGAQADLPENDTGNSRIPVYFKLPGDQPGSCTRGKVWIFWRLEAKAKMSGPDFFARFDVPVFSVVGAGPTNTVDPTTTLQQPVEEIRREEHSRIRVTDGPEGRVFFFPAARNPGAALSLTLAGLAFAGFVLVAHRLFDSRFFEITFGLVALLVFVASFNLWLKSTRVTVDSAGVRLTNRWLFVKSSRKFDALEIERFETRVGMASGQKALHILQLVTPGKRITLATGLGSAPEADWLVEKMTKALGRSAERARRGIESVFP